MVARLTNPASLAIIKRILASRGKEGGSVRRDRRHNLNGHNTATVRAHITLSLNINHIKIALAGGDTNEMSYFTAISPLITCGGSKHRAPIELKIRKLRCLIQL
jgi:hypothetical protein